MSGPIFNIQIEEDIMKDEKQMEYYKLINITDKVHPEYKFKDKKNLKQMYCRINNNEIEFYQCPKGHFEAKQHPKTISIEMFYRCEVGKKKEEGKFVLALYYNKSRVQQRQIKEQEFMMLLKFEKEADLDEFYAKISKLFQEYEQMVEKSRHVNYSSIYERINRGRFLLLNERPEKRWLFQQIIHHLKNKNEDLEELLLSLICDNENELDEIKSIVDNERYQVNAEQNSLQRMKEQKRIMDGWDEQVKKEVEMMKESYSRKRELEGIVPVNHREMTLTPYEQEKMLKEELFIKSVPDVNIDEWADEGAEMDIEVQRWNKEENHAKNCREMQIVGKKYSLVQSHSSFFVEKMFLQKNKQMKQKGKERKLEKQQQQPAKRVIEISKLLYRLKEAESATRLITQDTKQLIRDILMKQSRTLGQVGYMSEFTKRTIRNNYLKNH